MKMRGKNIFLSRSKLLSMVSVFIAFGQMKTGKAFNGCFQYHSGFHIVQCSRFRQYLFKCITDRTGTIKSILFMILVLCHQAFKKIDKCFPYQIIGVFGICYTDRNESGKPGTETVWQFF